MDKKNVFGLDEIRQVRNKMAELRPTMTPEEFCLCQ